MKELRFEWDDAKDSANRKKHRVSFTEAVSAFYDDNALLIADPDHSEEEDRFVLLGLSVRLRLLLVCHCYRVSDEVIRIFSARKADQVEREQYDRRLQL